MQFRDLLLPENILFGWKASSKRQLLTELGEAVSERTGIASALIDKALSEREKLGSTGIGHGIALPHATFTEISDPLCLAVKLSRPVDFEAVDEVPVELIFLVLSPALGKGEPLNLLSCIARRVREDDAINQLMAARTRDEFCSVLLA